MIFEGAPLTNSKQACNPSYDWGGLLSTELLQEIARHAGPQSLSILRCVCQNWRRGISRAVRTVRLTVPDQSTAPAAHAIAEPTAAEAQACPTRKVTGTGRPSGRVTANHAQQQADAGKAAEPEAVNRLVVRNGSHHKTAPAFPDVQLGDQASMEHLNQEGWQQQQHPTMTNRGFGASSGRPLLKAYATDTNSYGNGQPTNAKVNATAIATAGAAPACPCGEPITGGDTSFGLIAVGPRPCFAPRPPVVDSLAYVFNQHCQSMVAAVAAATAAAAAAAALTRKQGEASDSQAAGVASSVGSSSIAVWNFLEAADKLATAFPLYDNLSLNFAEPLMLATGGSGCEVGSGRWLQLEMSTALQRLLSNRLGSLSLSGHTPYPLFMAPPPLPLPMSTSTQAAPLAPSPSVIPSTSTSLRVAPHLARPQSPPFHFMSQQQRQQQQQQRPDQRQQQQERPVQQHRLKRSSKRSMGWASAGTPATGYAEEEKEAVLVAIKAPETTVEELPAALGGVRTCAKCEVGFGAGALMSYIQCGSEDERECQQQRPQPPQKQQERRERHDNEQRVAQENKQELDVGCCCNCSDRGQMILPGTASTTDMVITVADDLRAQEEEEEEGSTSIPRALGLDSCQQQDTSCYDLATGDLSNRHRWQTAVTVGTAAPLLRTAAMTPVLPLPEPQPLASRRSPGMGTTNGHHGSSGSAISEASLSLSARRHYEAAGRHDGGFDSAIELGRLRSQACGAVMVDSQLGQPETYGSGAAGEGVIPRHGGSGVPSILGGADVVFCTCFEGDNGGGGEPMYLAEEGTTVAALFALANGSGGNSERGGMSANEGEVGGSGGGLAARVLGSDRMDIEDGMQTAVSVVCYRSKQHVQPEPRVAAIAVGLAAAEAGMADAGAREEGTSRGDGGGGSGAKANNASGSGSGHGGDKGSRGAEGYTCRGGGSSGNIGGHPRRADGSAYAADAVHTDFHVHIHRGGGSSGHAWQALDNCCGRTGNEAVPTAAATVAAAAATAAGSGGSGGGSGGAGRLAGRGYSSIASVMRRRNPSTAFRSSPQVLDPYADSIAGAMTREPGTTVTGLTAATTAARAIATAAVAVAALDGVKLAADGQRTGTATLEVMQIAAGAGGARTEDAGAGAGAARSPPPLLSRLAHLVSLTLAADVGFPSPRQLEAITSLRNLQRLDMRGAKFMQVEEDPSLLARQAWLHVGNEHVAVVARCTSLISLSLNHLHAVGGLQLVALTALSKLTSLGLTDALSGNTVHSSHIRMLAEALTNLRSLEIGRVTCPPLHLPQPQLQQQQLMPVSLLAPASTAAAAAVVVSAAGPPPPPPPQLLQPLPHHVDATAGRARSPSPSTGLLHVQLWGPILGLFQGLTSLHLQVACSFETELLSGVAALPLLDNFSMELLDVPPSQLAAMLEVLVASGPRASSIGDDVGGDSGSEPLHAATLPRRPCHLSGAGGRRAATNLGGYDATTLLPYDVNPAAADDDDDRSGGGLIRVLRGLTLTACMLYDEHLELMGRLGSLRCIRLEQVDIRTRDPDGWMALSGVHALESFSFRVWNNPFLSASNLCVLTNDSLAMMAANWPHLQQLSYCGKVTLTEKAEEHLACMPRLTSLDITGTDGTLLRVCRSVATGQLLRTVALPHTTAAAKVSSRNGYVTYSDSDDSASSEGSEASVNWMGEVGSVTSEYDAD